MAGKRGIQWSRERLEGWVAQGLRQRDIAAMLGVTQSAVSYQMRQFGVRPLCRPEWPVEQIRRWIEEEDRTHAWVGAQLGCSDKQVTKLCKRHGVKSASRGPRGGAQHYAWRERGSRGKTRPTRRGRAVHREMVSSALGRRLERREVVHHLNFDILDNRPENLWLFPSQSEHLSWHRQLEEAARRQSRSPVDLALEGLPPGGDALHGTSLRRPVGRGAPALRQTNGQT